jgi:hypothetical protein
MRAIRFPLFCAALLVATATPAQLVAHGPASSAAPMPATHVQLVALFAEWRAFVRPATPGGVPDYSAAAMARKAAELPAWRARLAAIDRSGWSAPALGDYRLIEAEMNGFDFYLRILKPWARDPGFYQNLFGEQSDVPAHEGPSAQPNIDLFAYRWPLSRADDAKLTGAIATIPALLAAAKINLADSNAHDLWAYGDRAFKEQSGVLADLANGTLRMRTIDGQVPATITGASPALRKAIADAKAATDAFAVWVAAEAPRRQGPSGIGKANYDWYMQHVTLNPYDWDEQRLLLQRELDRSLASLRIEELRNRALPPIVEITDPVAYRAMAEAKTRKFNDFLVAAGLMPDTPYYRAAMLAQTSDYVPPAERNFFFHGTALDPLPLLPHSSHWIELARLQHDPHPSPIRDTPPLFNIFADRSEGFATAMEELLMQAGLYDDIPHGREIVWIMLANRAARGLASLDVQANAIDLAQAGRLHAEWTPRHWSDPDSPLVGFEQLLYLRQPGYGPSYIIGKLQLDNLLALASHEAETRRQPFVMRDAWARIIAAGIVPPALIKTEMFARP